MSIIYQMDLNGTVTSTHNPAFMGQPMSMQILVPNTAVDMEPDPSVTVYEGLTANFNINGLIFNSNNAAIVAIDSPFGNDGATFQFFFGGDTYEFNLAAAENPFGGLSNPHDTMQSIFAAANGPGSYTQLYTTRNNTEAVPVTAELTTVPAPATAALMAAALVIAGLGRKRQGSPAPSRAPVDSAPAPVI